MDNKCKGCTKREVGCHANCEDYKAYKEKLSEDYKKEYKERLLKNQLIESAKHRKKPLFVH